MALPEPDGAFLARVKTLAGAAARPVLADAVVVSSIMAHPRVDADGLSADDGGWTPTWNLYAIVSELWGVKAGMVAGDFNFKADSGDYSKGDVIAHCLAMEAKYAAMTAGSAPTGLTTNLLGDVVVNG